MRLGLTIAKGVISLAASGCCWPRRDTGTATHAVPASGPLFQPSKTMTRRWPDPSDLASSCDSTKLGTLQIPLRV
jgi:hypothetical protein